MDYIQKLFLLLDRKSKRQLLYLVGFSIFISLVEVVGISAFMPFIDMAVDFRKIKDNQYYYWVFVFFDFDNEINFVIFFGLMLSSFLILRGAINWLYAYKIADFTETLYADLGNRSLKTYMNMPYQLFSTKNTSFITKSIITEVNLVTKVVGAVLLLISEIFIIFLLYIIMLIASWKVTIIFTFIVALKVLFLTQTISKKIKLAGKIRAKTQESLYEILNRLLSNFKHVKLQERKRLKNIEDDFSESITQFAKSNVTNISLNAFPRIFLEAIGFTLIVLILVALIYMRQSNVLFILPILSLYVLALYRILPSINRIIGGYNTLTFFYESINIVSNELKTNQEKLGDKLINFNNEIKLSNVSFSYKDKNLFEYLNLTISKGEKIAFVGESGSGKSTLVDVICGLHQLKDGTIEIDGVQLTSQNLQNWRSQIGYIPQEIYLFDGTISENVCFGRQFNKHLLEKTLKQANIYDFLQTKEGTNTLVGEGGIQLSGGQKQRVAIARALYGQPNILVLDEATSSLDERTEQKIMDEIYNSSEDRTLIIIAHRISTVKRCNKVYQVKDGALDMRIDLD